MGARAQPIPSLRPVERRRACEEIPAFHVELMRASDNELATLVVEGARGAIQRLVLETMRAAEDWPSLSRTIATEHREILAATEAREPERASEHLARHVGDFYAAHVEREPVA